MPGYRILIVEDDRIQAFSLSHIISDMGYECLGVATSGEQALEMVMEKLPDLVIMDIKLPGIDGIITSQLIQKIKKTPIIFISGCSESDAILQAMGVMSGYISKPFHERDIRIALEIAFYKHESEMLIQENRNWLQTVLECIGEGIIATNSSGEIHLLNSEAKKILGLKDFKKGTLLTDLLSLYTATSDRPVPIPTSIEENVSFSSFGSLLHVKHNDGTIRYVDGTIAPIKDQSDLFLGLVVDLRDITERIETRESIDRAYHQIEENLEKFALLNDQIRNPLSVIVAIMDLDETDIIEKVMPYIQEIDAIITQLDEGYIVSSKVRNFLKRHHEIR